ncbi:glycine--tRNA ligase subunit beta [Gimibacter soli]|uniref:Glycine--tRNA ligase beta subunit n=1 Tax=Gimibacter soli TaxID=3024400 RepID=A0AAE9XUG9_9PROT|nr:glycine--tRNA ligase subunit beta [Gimibacter soli]WCL53793.1 glycine--tRNA ligase subunit beta [Gimibacter soli]
MAELLIELFSEEIPARMQAKAAEDLKTLMTDALKAAGLAFEAADAYATPRRLVLTVTGLPVVTPDVSEERRGPRADAPEKAIEGFLKGAGVTLDQCEKREDPKGTFLYAVIEKKGQKTADVVAKALEDAIRNFPWPKSQRWGAGSLRWVRPLQSILALLDGAVVPVSVDGIVAGNTTRGHRFMAPDMFAVADFADYKDKLLAHKVMLDPADRMALIENAAQSLAADKGLTLVEDKGLLAEVAGLVEWPVPLMGGFDPAFLDVPEEVLIQTMRKDQKYFVARDAAGKLAPVFITVANIVPSDGGQMVAAGNERVLTARLSDAKFFWETDLKVTLESRLPKLEEIVFHIKLGTVAERVERMVKLAGALADACGADRAEAERAARLAKADLVSGMVGEFPEVQGAMGRYYALRQGESAAVADAIKEHYSPLGPNDACPTAPVSIAVALAEKLDTLVGFFGIDEKPTGSKDPYALRRAALGIIRLIVENKLRVNLRFVIRKAAELYGIGFDDERSSSVSIQLIEFFHDRLSHQFRDEGIRHDMVAASMMFGKELESNLTRLKNRVAALRDFLATDDGVNLLAGYKRAANIIAKSGKDVFAEPTAALLQMDEERALFDKAVNEGAAVNAALEAEDFEGAMKILAGFRKPIDAFFDAVLVNADDEAVRDNRYALLHSFKNAVDRVADFSLIEG